MIIMESLKLRLTEKKIIPVPSNTNMVAML